MDGMTEEHLKSAIKKSRILFNRGEVNEVRHREDSGALDSVCMEVLFVWKRAVVRV